MYVMNKKGSPSILGERSALNSETNYVDKLLKSLVLAGAAIVGASNAACGGGPDSHKLTEAYVKQDFGKGAPVGSTQLRWYLVFKECPDNASDCNFYVFEAPDEGAARRVQRRLRPGNSYKFETKNLDSITEGK